MSKHKTRKKASFKQSDVCSPPADFCWYTAEMLEHPAFQTLSASAQRLLNFLEAALIRSAGQDNGKLLATYRQLYQWGVAMGEIPRAIKQLQEHGLLEVFPEVTQVMAGIGHHVIA